MLADDSFVFRAHLQIIFKDNGLTIEHEMLDGRVLFQRLQKPIHQVDEIKAELLEGQVPLMVPMGVRDDV